MSQQLLQPRLVLEGPLGLGLIVGESFFEPLQLLLFVRSGWGTHKSRASEGALINGPLLAPKKGALFPYQGKIITAEIRKLRGPHYSAGIRFRLLHLHAGVK